MNKAITDGLTLMPPPFSAGLGVWSSGDGTAGSATYLNAANAAYVPADPDFGGALDLQKVQDIQKLRYMGQTPIVPGMYLRVRLRIKAISGLLPKVRIAAWAGDIAGNNIASAVQTGPEVQLTRYGVAETLEAFIGMGNRPGVDMVWGLNAIYAHIGLDLTGASGGVVRIDDLEVTDGTDAFLRDMMDWVDVRDYGAVGDGVTDDWAAFTRADASADGRGVLVSAGTFRLGDSLTLNSRVRFEGRLSMAEGDRLSLAQNFDLASYAAAFGSETEGLRKAIQALFFFSDHVVLDLNGRSVDVTAPINVAALAGRSGEDFSARRLINNGQLNAIPGPAWDNGGVTAQATYAADDPYRLTGIAEIGQIEPGALVSGPGIARETYVRAVDQASGSVELSAQPGAITGTRSLTFTRHRYMLDFSGFGQLTRFEITNLEIECRGVASAVMLAPAGGIFRLHGCVIWRPKDRALTSIGKGCQGLLVDECQFISNETHLRAQDRTTICLNVNANDAKLRDNRVVRFAHFAVLHGTGHMLVGNHFFHGDSERPGVRRAGVIFTGGNVRSVMTGNYIDNASVELTNERDINPNRTSVSSLGGLALTGNTFMTIGAPPSFAWIVVTPHGTGHFVDGLSVTGNTFRCTEGDITRAEKVDTTWADLDYSRMHNVVFSANTWLGVDYPATNPRTVRHVQLGEAATWTVDSALYLPFRSWALNVTALVAQGPITSGGATQFTTPYALAAEGSGRNLVRLVWPQPSKGQMNVTVRMDSP